MYLLASSVARRGIDFLESSSLVARIPESIIIISDNKEGEDNHIAELFKEEAHNLWLPYIPGERYSYKTCRICRDEKGINQRKNLIRASKKKNTRKAAWPPC